MGRLQDALSEMLRRSFAESTPKGDFDKLLEEASVNDRGEKEIPFLDYEIEAEALHRIFKEVCEEFSIGERDSRLLAIHYYLGCSPTTKYSEDSTSNTKAQDNV